MDSDGDFDLLLGRYNGTIAYFDNIGEPTQFSLSLITEEFAGVNLGYQNPANPTFCDIDADGDYNLFVGTHYGQVYYYQNIGTPQQYNSTLISSNWQGIDVGDYASPEFCDIDGDGDYDLFIGKDNDNNYTIPGALHYWENIGTPLEPNFVEISQNYLTFDAGMTCEASLCDIDLDGNLDLFFLNNVQLGWMQNVGTVSSPSFILQSFNVVDGIAAGSVDLGELNADGNPDLVSVEGWTGDVTLWMNDGLFPDLSFTPVQSFPIGEIAGSPQLADLDADGDNDLVIVSWGGDLRHYENQGSAQVPHFVEVAQSLPGITNIWMAPFCLHDFDSDGDFDFLIRTYDASAIVYYENTGGPYNMYFDCVTTDLLGFSPVFLNANFGDMDGDGDSDIFLGGYYGGLQFIRNVTGEPAVPPLRRHPRAGLQLSLSPNPANPVTWVTFHLPALQRATLAVYNLLGQKVATLAQGLQPPGTSTYLWNAAGFVSGVYVLKLEVEKGQQVGKVVVLR